MATLNIKPAADCCYDLLSLGEIMLRLDPGEGRIRTAREFKVWEGGGEYNVARGLRRCFGLRTAIATAALQMIPGVDMDKCRTPEILADAAHLILTSDAATTSGNFFIDDELLAAHGITDLERYSVRPGTTEFMPDLFVDLK